MTSPRKTHQIFVPAILRHLGQIFSGRDKYARCSDFWTQVQMSNKCFSLQEDGEIENLYTSSLKFSLYDKNLHLNLHKNHFSYIKNIKTHGRKFKCSKCQYLTEVITCTTCTKICSQEIKEYLGGKSDPRLDTVFDKLEKLHICITDREYHFVSVFDFEAMQVKRISKFAWVRYTLHPYPGNC